MCRWSVLSDDTAIFLKNNKKYLNIWDVEKQALLWTSPFLLDSSLGGNVIYKYNGFESITMVRCKLD